MTQEEMNKEFGRNIADWMWQEGVTKCPFILNTEQADALHERWKELQNQRKAMQQKTVNYKAGRGKRKRK